MFHYLFCAMWLTGSEAGETWWGHGSSGHATADAALAAAGRLHPIGFEGPYGPVSGPRYRIVEHVVRPVGEV